jgi:phage terminase small subunit
LASGKVGRPRKSTKQKIIEGTYRHDRDDDRADVDFPVITNVTAIKAPVSITDKKVRAHFETLVKNLLAVQALTEQDLAALEMAHLSLERANILMKKLISIEKLGLVGDKDTYGPVMRSYRQAAETYTSIVYRFGVSPVERSKIVKKISLDNGQLKLAEILSKV